MKVSKLPSELQEMIAGEFDRFDPEALQQIADHCYNVRQLLWYYATDMTADQWAEFTRPISTLDAVEGGLNDILEIKEQYPKKQ